MQTRTKQVKALVQFGTYFYLFYSGVSDIFAWILTKVAIPPYITFPIMGGVGLMGGLYGYRTQYRLLVAAENVSRASAGREQKKATEDSEFKESVRESLTEMTTAKCQRHILEDDLVLPLLLQNANIVEKLAALGFQRPASRRRVGDEERASPAVNLDYTPRRLFSERRGPSLVLEKLEKITIADLASSKKEESPSTLSGYSSSRVTSPVYHLDASPATAGLPAEQPTTDMGELELTEQPPLAFTRSMPLSQTPRPRSTGDIASGRATTDTLGRLPTRRNPLQFFSSLPTIESPAVISRMLGQQPLQPLHPYPVGAFFDGDSIAPDDLTIQAVHDASAREASRSRREGKTDSPYPKEFERTHQPSPH